MGVTLLGITACAAASKSTPHGSPGEQQGRLGQKLTGNGSTVKVASVAQGVTAAPQFGEPPSGAQWAGVLAQVCSTGGASTHVSASEFMLVQQDNVLVAPTMDLDVPGKPGLADASVPPGHCTQGWVFFAPRATPVAVVDPEAKLRWVVSS